MGKSAVTMTIENATQLIGKINAKEKEAEKAVADTVKDMKARAPGWIAAEVTKVYNIKRADVTPTGKGKLAGKTRLQTSGKTIEDFAVKYVGQLLTPYHFGMTPKAPTGGTYTLKMQVIKGQKKVLGKVKKLTKKQRAELAKNFTRSGAKRSSRSPIMLMGTGNTKQGGVDWIPFQRQSQNRKDIRVIKTVSIPQMVTSERTNGAIMAKLNTEAAKRLEHHIKRNFKTD